MPFITQGKTNWKYILIVVILAFIVGGGILAWRYWLAPPHFDLSTSKYICRDGSPALSERLDKFREIQCLDCMMKTAYMCGEKFWIHEYGGLPGQIVNKWSGPYNIKRLQEFKEVPIPPSKVEDETANWKTYRNEEYGFEIKYPEKLNTEFISLHSKSVPPKMVVSSNISQLVCEEFERKSTVEFPTASQKKITVEGETYCRFSGAEGTAGTTYVTYRYSTIKNEKQITLEFTLLYPDCGNYYGIDNKMEKCRQEEDTFNPDILAHQMLSTFRFLE